MANVWITGASTGIGRALAVALAKQGHWLAISARNQSKLTSLAEELEQASPGGHTARCYPLDINDQEATYRCVEAIVSHMGSIDWVFLNAAYYEPTPSQALSLAAFTEHNKTNYIGTMNCLVPVIEHARSNKSDTMIYLTASLAGYRGLPNAAPYNATKAALISVAESLHPDLAREGIHIGVINPGFVQTPLTEKNRFAMPAILTPEQAAESILKRLPKKPFQIAFPRRLAWALNLMRCLPYPLFFWIINNTINKNRKK